MLDGEAISVILIDDRFSTLLSGASSVASCCNARLLVLGGDNRLEGSDGNREEWASV